MTVVSMIVWGETELSVTIRTDGIIVIDQNDVYMPQQFGMTIHHDHAGETRIYTVPLRSDGYKPQLHG